MSLNKEANEVTMTVVTVTQRFRPKSQRDFADVAV